MSLKKLLLVVLSAVPLPALASTVVLNNFTYVPAESVTVATPAYSGQAGQYSGTLDGNAFTSYCVEITQSVSFGVVYDYTVQSGETAWTPTQLARLEKLFTMMAVAGAPSNAEESAFFQLVVWEILYEDNANDLNLLTGTFSATGLSAGVLALATAYGNFGATLDATVATVKLNRLYSAIAQDLVIVVGIPEPGTLALMGLGLLGLGAGMRRRAS